MPTTRSVSALLTAAEPATPTEVVAAVRAARERAAAAEVEVLLLGLQWARSHPDLTDPTSLAGRVTDDDVEGLAPEAAEWVGIPAIAWDAPATFATANAMTTHAGRTFLRDALVLRHRLPLLFARVVAGHVPVWQARRVAQRVLARPDDVTAWIDRAVEERAGLVGPIVLDRLIDQAMLTLYAEQREADQLDALDHRHATLHLGSINHTGLVEMAITADLPDLHDFDQALARVAAAQAAQPDADPLESLDTRRARAVGVLADPEAALALLAGDADWANRHTRRIELVVHLSDLALLGGDPAAAHRTPGTPGLTPSLDATVRAWCSQPGVTLTVRPVLDLTVPIVHDGYQPTDTQRTYVEERDTTCVFPHCSTPARGCDLDHLVPWERGGPTHVDNLAALCRHHHRLKTHAGWRYRSLGDHTSTAYLWHDSHGQTLLRTRNGTRDLTPPAPQSATPADLET